MSKHDISQRRACRLVSVDPKTVRRERPPDCPEIRHRMRAIAGERRRFGYRRIGLMLEREGMVWSGHEIEAIEWFEAARRFGIAARWGTWHDFGIAYYLAGRYQDAVMIELEGADRQANDWITPLILAAAYVQLGNAEQAADAVRDLLRLRPFFSIEQWASQFPDPDDAAHMVIGLETAGLGKSIEEE